MISAEHLDAAASLIAQHGVGDKALEALRTTYPALRFIVCSDDDVPARLNPTREGAGYALYLIGSGDHCLTLTKNEEQAIGIVLAEVLPDEG